MNIYEKLYKLMFETNTEEDGIKYLIISSMIYRLLETAGNRGLTYMEAKYIKDYCGLGKEDFCEICDLVDQLYCKTEDPEITIDRLVSACIQLYDENKLSTSSKWEIYDLALNF